MLGRNEHVWERLENTHAPFYTQGNCFSFLCGALKSEVPHLGGSRPLPSGGNQSQRKGNKKALNSSEVRAPTGTWSGSQQVRGSVCCQTTSQASGSAAASRLCDKTQAGGHLVASVGSDVPSLLLHPLQMLWGQLLRVTSSCPLGASPSIPAVTLTVTFQSFSLEHALGMACNSSDHFQTTSSFHCSTPFYTAALATGC